MRISMIGWMAIFLSGCVASFTGPVFTGAVDKVPYGIRLTVTSEIEDPFYVTRGPFGSYRPFPVNGWLQRELSRLAESKSGGEGSLAVRVRFFSLKTDYDGIGQIQPLPSILSRSEPPDLPERAIKSATLKMEVVIAGDRVLFNEKMTERVVQELAYDNLTSSTQYGEQLVDYRPVLESLVIATVARVNAAIDDSVKKRGK